MPQAYWIIPLEGGQIDNSLPGGRPGHVGNRPPGSWGGPVDPGWGGGGPDHIWGGVGGRPDHPDQGLPGGGHASGQPIVPPQGGTEVPEDEYQPLPPPEDITSQYVVSVWNPKTASWTTKSYPPR
jgi:hypothetical protein